MAKLRMMSDIHLEFDTLVLRPAGEDVLCLAGDIGVNEHGFDWAMEQSQKLGVPVVYIPGNHEAYQLSFHGEYSFRSLIAALEERSVKSGGAVSFLYNNLVDVAGVLFAGTTLWTDYALYGNQILGKQDALWGLNDFNRIRFDEKGELLNPRDCLSEHELSRAFLESVRIHNDHARPLVIMTHHAPSARSLDARYGNDSLNVAYASNLDELVESSGAVVWQHGHIHASKDYKIGETRVVSNPRGYARYAENEDWNPDFIIEI